MNFRIKKTNAKHENKIVYNQKFKNNLIKSPIINNNDNSFREEYSLNKKKKNHTIFIEIINNPNNQNKQSHYNNHFNHIDKANNDLHKKTKTRSSLSEKEKIERNENSPEKNSKILNVTYIKTINIYPKRFK